MIKALFFDLDGTLLTSQKALLPSTHAALLHCREQGIRVFLATARSPRLTTMLGWSDAELSLFSGGLYSNGACIQLDGQTRYAYIDPRAVASCILLAEQYGVQLSLHMEGDLHAFNHHLPDRMLKPWGVKRSDILPLDAQTATHAVKILLYTDYLVESTQELPAGLFSALQAACGHQARLYLTDGGRTIQVAGLTASKQAAIEAVCTQLNILPAETAVFGDDLNDMEMLAHCPNSIAMGNAHPQIKATAAHVTLTNDEGGIAYALEKILHLTPPDA